MPEVALEGFLSPLTLFSKGEKKKRKIYWKTNRYCSLRTRIKYERWNGRPKLYKTNIRQQADYKDARNRRRVCTLFRSLLTKELNFVFLFVFVFVNLSTISALLSFLFFYFDEHFHIFIVLSFESRSRVEIHSDVMFVSSSGHIDCACARLFVCTYEIDEPVRSLTSVRSINYQLFLLPTSFLALFATNGVFCFL